jgi:antitoxin (DNA-binding transcriptional repressor) of toxin-antitoxin stability system
LPLPPKQPSALAPGLARLSTKVGHIYRFNDKLDHSRKTCENHQCGRSKERLSELVRRAALGEEFVISRNGQPQAQLVPLPARQARVPGKGAGQWVVSEDFNDPLPGDPLTAFQGKNE